MWWLMSKDIDYTDLGPEHFLTRTPGKVLTDFQKGHAGADVLRFFTQIDSSVPRGLGIHLATSTPPASPG